MNMLTVFMGEFHSWIFIVSGSKCFLHWLNTKYVITNNSNLYQWSLVYHAHSCAFIGQFSSIGWLVIWCIFWPLQRTHVTHYFISWQLALNSLHVCSQEAPQQEPSSVNKSRKWQMFRVSLWLVFKSVTPDLTCKCFRYIFLFVYYFSAFTYLLLFSQLLSRGCLQIV